MAGASKLPGRRAASVGAVAALSAGCAALFGPGGTGSATITVRAHVVDAPYRTQAVVAPYTASTIQHVAIKVFTLASGQEVDFPGAGRDVAQAALSGTLTIGGLRHDTPYRIRAYAYKAAGTDPADQISVDASSSVDVTVARDDRPPIATLPIRLADQVFSGQATGSLAITDGVLAPPGTETAAFATPTPTPPPTPTPTPEPNPRVVTHLSSGSYEYLRVDGGGNFYTSDLGGRRIVKVTPDNTRTTLAGSGEASSVDNADGSLASINDPAGLALTPGGSVLWRK